MRASDMTLPSAPKGAACGRFRYDDPEGDGGNRDTAGWELVSLCKRCKKAKVRGDRVSK